MREKMVQKMSELPHLVDDLLGLGQHREAVVSEDGESGGAGPARPKSGIA